MKVFNILVSAALAAMTVPTVEAGESSIVLRRIRQTHKHGQFFERPHKGLEARTLRGDRGYRGAKDKEKDSDDEDKDKDNIEDEIDLDDDNDVCLNNENIFRTCGKGKGGKGLGRRTLSSLHTGRKLKGGRKDSPMEPPRTSYGYNLEIGDITFTLGANIKESLADGCDCRLEMEEALITYLGEFFNNAEYNFLCAAVFDFDSTNGVTTKVQTSITFQVDGDFEENFEVQSECTLGELVLCCLEDGIEGASLSFDCEASGCDLSFCRSRRRRLEETVDIPTPAPTTAAPSTAFVAQLLRRGCTKEENLQDFLSCAVDTCVDEEGNDANIFQALPFLKMLTSAPSVGPTVSPTDTPSVFPTLSPSVLPSKKPSEKPTNVPSAPPTDSPSSTPTAKPTAVDTSAPTILPTIAPSPNLSNAPTESPTAGSTGAPSLSPTFALTQEPTNMSFSAMISMDFSFTAAPVTALPTTAPTVKPSSAPTAQPSFAPSNVPTLSPTVPATEEPVTLAPTEQDTLAPTETDTEEPTFAPSFSPTFGLTESPVFQESVSFSFPFSILSFSLPDFSFPVAPEVSFDPQNSL